nr:MAG TPA_asm: hypothetical protein [Caudoviricetes sp.]
MYAGGCIRDTVNSDLHICSNKKSHQRMPVA